MNEEIIESKNENARRATKPFKFMAGISIQRLEKPEKVNRATLNIGTINVTKYKTIAEETHLNSPKVTKFNGSSNKLITGFAKKETAAIAAPAKRRV